MALNNLLHLVFSGDKLKLFQVSNGLSEYFTIFTEDCRIMNLTQHFVSITSNSISTKTSKMTYLQRQYDTYLYNFKYVCTILEVYLPFGNLLWKGTFVAVEIRSIGYRFPNWKLVFALYNLFQQKAEKGQNIGKPIFHTSAARCLKANIG